MISIVVANWNSYDFLDLLIESLDLFSSVDYKLIVIDNSLPELQKERDLPDVMQFMMGHNLGHGWSLNHGVYEATRHYPHHPYLMFLDVDCHILCRNWEQPFLDQMEQFDIVGGRGVPEKPIRPACMFMKKEIGQKYSWEDTPNYKGERKTPASEFNYDVAIQAYHKMTNDGIKIGFLEGKKNRYGTVNGEEWCLDGVPLVYHHWSGTWLKERQMDFPDVDLFEDKAKLFSKIPWRLP